jgi:mannose-6-phosphate isomerase
MWYIISTGKDGEIMAGLNSRATKISLLDRLESGKNLEELLQTYSSKPGDAFFIPSGTIHAIGQNNLLLEIQQNSDTTYRLSDWGRLDSNGNPRALHIENGIKSIDFTNKVSTRIAGAVDTAPRNRKFETVICPYFQVFDLKLASIWEDNTDNSFHLLSAINAPIKVIWQGQTYNLPTGRTMLIPAACGNYTIDPDNVSNVTVIKTTL